MASNQPTSAPATKQITIFGGTGKTGRHLVQGALDAGHEVTVLARTPSKRQFEHGRLRVLKGDIEDPITVARAIDGSDAVLSILGPTQNTPDYQVSHGTQHILEAMKRHGVKRLIIAAGAGVKLINHGISFALKRAARHVLEDMTRTVQAVRDSDLDWTIVRVPMLLDDPPKGKVRVGWVGVDTDPRLTRTDMASFMLTQLQDSQHIWKRPVISN